ncbi:brain-specific angiogenesis inhibitor 1-associated protein 2 [Caerostris extrusa]|uniref:Brain-specific angiogenesis inhibitor 1-associated protein 2 n=1 Tax=Caerostris extrusa TaxID=172846 RepID=A0AAV4X8S1_CAEEX|nr:brain-specific angiogenesis inhibitor 1-associated protein 2 [Caerostris extrusa]
MDTSEGTAKVVDTTYKNIIEEFGPCTKQLVVAGRTYLKSLNAMVAASRQYTDALAKIASLANNSTMSGSRDIGGGGGGGDCESLHVGLEDIRSELGG